MKTRLIAVPHWALMLLALTGCVADFPTVSPNALLTDSGSKDANVMVEADANGMLDATLTPDADVDGDAAIDSDDGVPPDAEVPDMPLVMPPDLGPLDLGPPDLGCVAVAETCNGLDDDCDGRTDEALPGVGEPCEMGLGACAQTGEMRCNPEAGMLTCNAMPGLEIFEICNGIDDDCDGFTDEALGLGDACEVGVGQCLAAGVNQCGDAGDVICDAQEGMAADELCNGLDDDCDGTPDEAFGLGDDCAMGVGACRRVGAIACFSDIAACDAEPGLPGDEACNEIDDDCDGQADEGLGKGDDCVIGMGACQARGVRICGPDGAVQCDAPIIEPQAERCNAIDDDCDGLVDQGLGLGEVCEVGLGECAAVGQNVCGAEDGVICNALPLDRADEVCDGLDNDCDGAVDEAETCVRDAITGCQVWLGWRDVFPHNADRTLSPAANWGDCPGDLDDLNGNSRCNSTRGNANYQSFGLSGTADHNDVLAIRFTCDEGEIPSWVQDHCEVFLAYGDLTTPAEVEAFDPERCDSTFSSPRFEPELGCVRTGHDTLFHPIAWVGGVNFDDAWGVALRCDDPALPDRAAGLQSNLMLHLAIQDRGIGPLGCSRRRIADQASWSEVDDTACPLIGSDLDGRETCASSSGDGQFHGVKVNQGQLGRCWNMGVALKPVSGLRPGDRP